MKRGRDIALRGVQSGRDAVRRVLRIRFAECLEKHCALSGADDEALHAFRLACKRLRYAIERFTAEVPQLAPAADALGQITDELGASHDFTLLARRARACGAEIVRGRAQAGRDAHRKRARRLWESAFAENGVFAALAAESGFPWRLA